jgi:hypothetical protein
MTVPIPDPDFKLQQGGVVLVSPAIYSVFLGNSWNTDPEHSARMGRLKQFLNDLPASGFMNVLSQYGCGFGANDAGCSIQSFVVPNDAVTDDQELQGMLQQMIDPFDKDKNPLGGKIPNPGTPPTICVLVFLANNLHIGNFGLADSHVFAYHSHFTTTRGDLLSYGLISPANLNEIKNFIPDQINAQTVLCSHEYAEMLTNPSHQGCLIKYILQMMGVC